MVNHWVGTVSREHVRRGVAGGFMQLCHGKKAPLQRMKAGDGIVIYSPRTAFPAGAPLQAFTALGRVRDGRVYQVEMSPDFHPYRIDIDFVAADEAPIRPLVPALDFIRDKTHWGAVFRFGYARIEAADFERIARAMGVAPALAQAA